jgi:hypothetical protein
VKRRPPPRPTGGRLIPITYPVTTNPDRCPTCNAVDDEICTNHNGADHSRRPRRNER